MSKKVFIKRTKPYHPEGKNDPVLIEQENFTRKSIGSYFASKDSAKKGSGLSFDEEKYLLPEVIDVPNDDKDFRRKVDLYYTEVDTVIPAGEKGIELEIGLEDSDKGLLIPIYGKNEKGEVTEKIVDYKLNRPLNVVQFIKYKHALGHPDVAKTPEQAKGNRLYKFVIVDPTVQSNKELEAIQAKDKGREAYLRIKDDKKKIRMVLTLLEGNIPREPQKPRIVVHQADDIELLKALNRLVEKFPEKVVEVYNDEEASNKYRLKQLQSQGLIIRENDTFLVPSFDHKPIGTTLDAATRYLFDPVNSEMLQTLKARMTKTVEV